MATKRSTKAMLKILDFIREITEFYFQNLEKTDVRDCINDEYWKFFCRLLYLAQMRRID